MTTPATDLAATTEASSTADAPTGDPANRALTPGAQADGTGYRAIVTDGGRVVWACSHVHFTDHSARRHAEQHIETMLDTSR